MRKLINTFTKIIKKPLFIKIVIIIMLFGALFNNDYGYYEILKWIICSSFLYLSYNNHKNKNDLWFWFFIFSAIIFNPIIKIRLEKEMWILIDVIIMIITIISVFNLKKIPKNEDTTINKYKNKELTIWKWYFGWHPRIFFTIPIFIIFVYQGIWLILSEISDIIIFFQDTSITWGRIFLVIFLGSFLLTLILSPIYISFCSISWLYEVNEKNQTPWKKFMYSLGIILLVVIGTSLIKIFTAWLLGVL